MLPTPAHALAQSRPSSGLAGWLASPSRPLPARRHNGGRGRHWPARCRQSSPSSGLAGWLASPSRPLPGATTAGGGGTGPRDAASSARCAALLCGTRPQAARAGSPALLQARRRARREGRPRVDANPCCARLCAPCQVGTEPGAGRSLAGPIRQGAPGAVSCRQAGCAPACCPGNGEQQEATRERARKHQGYVRQTRRRGGDGDDERGG